MNTLLLRRRVAWIIWRLRLTAGDILSDFSARLLIQKVAYIMKTKELLDMEFNLHIHGPYSSELADIYMELAREGDEVIKRLASQYKPREDEESIVQLIMEYIGNYNNIEHGLKVLETATTIYDIYDYNKPKYTIKDAIEHAAWLKPWIEDGDYINEALKLLKTLGLLKN